MVVITYAVAIKGTEGIYQWFYQDNIIVASKISLWFSFPPNELIVNTFEMSTTSVLKTLLE